MAKVNSNVLLIILAGVIILIAVMYYLNKNDTFPIPNQGTITNNSRNVKDMNHNQLIPKKLQQIKNNHHINDISDSVVDDLVSQYNIRDNLSDDDNGNFSPSDPMAKDYGQYSNYVKKKHHNTNKMEVPFDNENDFTYKKKKYTRRTPEDIKDLFDIDKMLPQEIEEDWFDVEPLQSTKKIKGIHMIHPKVHIGSNTVGSSLKNASHDIRGDIPIEKKIFSPYLNSTIDPDINIKGFCNQIY
jgi:hypothetical protein